MATQKIHVVPHEEGWAVKMEGESDPTSVRRTKKEALNAGKTLALVEGAAVVVHRQDGTFGSIIPFREVREEAERSTPGVAEPRRRPRRSRYERDEEAEEGALNWTALLLGAASIVGGTLALQTLARRKAEGREQAEY